MEMNDPAIAGIKSGNRLGGISQELAWCAMLRLVRIGNTHKTSQQKRARHTPFVKAKEHNSYTRKQTTMVYHIRAKSPYYYPNLLDHSLLDDDEEESDYEVPTTTRTPIWILPPTPEIKRITRANLEEECRQYKRILGEQKLREERRNLGFQIHEHSNDEPLTQRVIDSDDLIPTEMLNWLDYRSDNNINESEDEHEEQEECDIPNKMEDNNSENYEIFIRKTNAFDESDELNELFRNYMPLENSVSYDEDKENRAPNRQ